VESSALLTAWKKTEELAFLNEVSSVPLQQALRHLQGAFASFWEKRARYPRFKSRKKSRLSAEYTRSAFSCRGGELKLAKMAEPLAIVWSRALPEGVEPSTVTVSRDSAGRWFVSILCEDVTVKPLPAAPNPAVGIDAGINALLTLSTGERIVNPKFEKQDRERLAKAQRRLARKEKGSANRDKARVQVARVHARIADRRRDHLHQLTTRLVREKNGRDRGPLCAQHACQSSSGPRDLGRLLVRTARPARIQVRLVWQEPGRNRPVLPLVQDVQRLRARHYAPAAVRAHLPLQALRLGPGPGRERGTQH
jgi:transposase